LQKSASGTEVQRSASPVGNGARERGPALRGFLREVSPCPRCRELAAAVAKPRSQGTPEPDARKGVAGQRFLTDGRHLGPLHRPASFTRWGRGRSRQLPRFEQVARATCPTWKKRQGCQRFGPHASRREDNARRGDTTTRCGPTEANRTDVRQAMSPMAQAPKAHDAPGTDEARVLVRRT